MKKSLVLGIMLSLIAAGSCHAEEVKAETFNLDELIVTATVTPKRDVEVPAMTQIYDAKKIEESGARDVMEFMQYTVGAEVLDTTAPAKNGIHFRGTGSTSRMRTSALVMINGVPVNVQGRSDISAIPTSLIERIEIVNGGGSVLYGTDALDGMVNIILKKKMKNRITVGYGPHGKRVGDVALQLGDFNFAYSYDHINERGHHDILGLGSTPDRHRYGGDYDRRSIFARYAPDEHFDVFYMDKKYSNDYYYKNANKDYNDPDATSRLASFTYKNKDFKINTYYKDYGLGIDTTSKGIKKQTTDNSSRAFGIDINNKFKFGKGSIYVGANFENENMDMSMGKYSRNQKTKAIYALAEMPVGEKTTISLGGREVWISDLGSKFCPQFNVLHKLNTNQSLFLNVNKAFRAPLAEELFGNPAHGYAGNLDLRPETGWIGEFGYKKVMGDSSLKLAAFFMKIDDRIDRDTTKTYRNMAEFENKGIEFVFDQKVSDKFSYSLGATYASPKERKENGAWAQSDYKIGANLGLHYRINKFKANLYSNLYAKQASKTDGTAVGFNTNLSYTPDAHSEFALKIINIANDDGNYRVGCQFPNRSALLTYTYTF
ncbi:MAG: TonB-dependent receptor [Phascolarctobacterium sp.]|nr:TonB-dependent receptor [Phascolarctobacterium sp.]